MGGVDEWSECRTEVYCILSLEVLVPVFIPRKTDIEDVARNAECRRRKEAFQRRL